MFEHKNIYYVDYFYHTFTSFFMVKEQFLITSSAKMIQLVFWLLGLVFMMFMISNMVLEFFRQYKIRLTNFGQLNGQVIYTEDLFSNYTTDFLSYQGTLLQPRLPTFAAHPSFYCCNLSSLSSAARQKHCRKALRHNCHQNL